MLKLLWLFLLFLKNAKDVLVLDEFHMQGGWVTCVAHLQPWDVDLVLGIGQVYMDSDAWLDQQHNSDFLIAVPHLFGLDREWFPT